MLYFMIFTYLTSFCEVRQVAKFPNLIGHFILHQKTNHTISLYAFFKMHYLDEQLIDNDYNDDMSLPFKTHDFTGTLITLNVPPEKAFLNMERQSIFVDYSGNFSHTEKFYPSIFLSIWEPPKI